MDIEAQIGLLLQASSDTAKAAKRMSDTYARLVQQGRRVNLTGALTVTAAGPQVIDLGACPVGMLWEVKNAFASPPDLSAGGIPSGVSTYLFGGTFGGPRATDYSANALLGWTAQFPSQFYGGTHESYVSGSEHLYMLFTGATVGSQIFAAALVLQSPLNTTERADL